MTVAIALFLGGFGVHKFYLEKPGVGLLHLLFYWKFIPAIVDLLEAIYYLAIGEAGFRKMIEEDRHWVSLPFAPGEHKRTAVKIVDTGGSRA